MKKDFINLNDINKKIEEDCKKVIVDAESFFRSQLFDVANKILKQKDVKVILMAGPSCAGKTTSANLIKSILEVKGKEVISIAMDNFFKNTKDRKILPDGSIDFDSPDCVNTKQMSECFKKLFKNGEALFPEFDFITGENIEGQIKYTFNEDTIIIFEGIHVLNPEIIKHLETKNFIKIYVSNYSGFKDENLEISTRKFRLVRRMVRDMIKRGVNPSGTLKMWKNITDAEDQFIVPFKETSDYQINTTHSYEMGLYKKYILNAIETKELSLNELPWLKLFEKAKEVDKSLLPHTTLMHEFL